MTRFTREAAAAAALVLLLAACGGDKGAAAKAGDNGKSAAAAGGDTSAQAQGGGQTASAAAPGQDNGPKSKSPVNELGKVLVLEYHRIGPHEGEWYRSEEHFRNDLKMLYDRGFRPITMREVANGDINLPAGTSPVVFVFDDSSQGQFYYLPNGQIDPHTMVGMWQAFKHQNPAWHGGATYCVLPGAVWPSNFWGEKPTNQVPRQQREDEIRRKVSFLLQDGNEICDHTMWHASLSKYPDAFVEDQIGSGKDSVQTYLPANYNWTTFALPLGLWPKNRPLAWHGTYRNGKTYDFKVVLEVSGGPGPSPFDQKWNPHSVKRFIAGPGQIEHLLADWDAHPGDVYVSDGDPNTVSFPQHLQGNLNQGALGHRHAKALPDNGPPQGKPVANTAARPASAAAGKA